MHRDPLITQLERYRPADSAEQQSRARILAFIRAHSDCFERSLSVGHITGSAWLLDRSGTRALLTFHRKLGKWLQLGGHADGEPDVLGVAIREAREESGIEALNPVTNQIFDVDVHRIPARGDEPEHDHYDVRFLIRTVDHDSFRLSDESLSLRWFKHEDLRKIATDVSVERMARKWAEFGWTPFSAE